MTEDSSQLYTQENERVSVNNLIENAVFSVIMVDIVQLLEGLLHEV